MPRIPNRVEPYSSPHLRQRHFKSKRDSILRSLGSASYINGSHFAILWVNARGETEQYASELLQPKLSAWFTPEVVAEARQLVMAGGQAQAYHDSGLAQIMEREAEQEEGRTDNEEEDSPEHTEQVSAGTMFTWDPKVDLARERPQSQQSQVVPGGGLFRTLDFTDTMRQRDHAPTLRRTYSMPNPPVQEPPQSGVDIRIMKLGHAVNRPPVLDVNAIRQNQNIPSAQVTPMSGGAEYKALTIGNDEEVSAFLQTRLRQLQQIVCKIVAKAWIKVIEPKKQTKYPYNRGDESKPSWWPKDCRHKEPDHLMKPERISLLMTMLRCGRVPTNRLELATAEVAAFIRPDKMNLLREIYRVAREEERFRNNEIPGDTKLYVATSAVFNPALEDLNSPDNAGLRIAEVIAPRSASMHDAHMEMQRSTSHETPHFDEHDPFAEVGEMHQNYAILPAQNFYYNNATPPFPEQAGYPIIMNNAQKMTDQGGPLGTNNNNSALSNQQFQQAQHHMFLAQQAQALQRRQSGPELGRSQTAYMTQQWPQNIGHSWQPSAEVFQHTAMEGHAMHQSQMQLESNSQAAFYQQSSLMETPAKQSQQERQDQQSLRSSPYLPTPLRSNIEGSFSASRNQGVSFSDFLHSPRTAVPSNMHEDEMKEDDYQ